MATNGQIQTNTSFGHVRLEWSQASQNVANNTTTINYTLSIYRSSAISSNAAKNFWININGVTIANGTTTIGGSGTKNIFSGTTTIVHNADGTKSFGYAFSLQADITWSGVWIGFVEGTGTGTLNTIPRATQPTLSAGAVDMGATLTINTPRASSAFTHTLRYGFGSLRGTIATGVATSHTWTVPMNMANQIGHATSGVAVIWCDTYNGGTLIGTKEISFTARVPENIKPYFSTISVTEATEGLAAKFNAYVQHKSRVTLNSTALGVYSSQIVSYRHVFSGTNWAYASQNFTSGNLPVSGSVTITSYCTDTRGRTGSATTVINVLPYEAPRIAAFSATRALSTGVENYDGTHLRCAFNFAISSLNNLNNRTYSIQYKLKSATQWTTLTTNNSTYSANSTYTSPAAILSDTNSYDVRFYLEDYFGSVTAAVDVGTAFTLLDFRSTGRGVGIGKASEKDAVEIAIPLEVDGQPIKGGAITVYNNASQAITTNQYTKCNFNSVMGVAGTNLRLANNNVVCQKAGFVEASGMISITDLTTTGDNYYVFLFKETAAGAGSSLNISARTLGTDWTTLQLNPVVVDVAAGDKIYIAVLNSSARGTISNGDNLAWMNKLTVKYVG